MADPIADALKLAPITLAANAVSVKAEKCITIQPTDSADAQVKNDF